LRERHQDELPPEHPFDSSASFLGTCIHTGIEKLVYRSDFNREFWIEKRFYNKYLGRKVVGKVDYYQKNTGVIVDVKTAAFYKGKKAMDGDLAEYEDQLNIYAYLAEQDAEPVTGLVISMLHPAWSPSRAQFDAKCPPFQHSHQIPLWPYDTREEFLLNRLKLHIEAEDEDDEYLPACTDEERWWRNDEYAVMVKGKKRSARNVPTEEEAHEFVRWVNEEAKKPGSKRTKIKDYKVELRPGRYVRCEDYCNVSSICSQYQAELNS
jgi:hypothetical protein